MSNVLSWASAYALAERAPAGRLFGLPANGAMLAGLTRRAVDDPRDADWLIDVEPHHSTRIAKLAHRLAKPVWSPLEGHANPSNCTLIFPWESTQLDSHKERLEAIGRQLILALGYDARESVLAETPARWAQWWTDFLHYEPRRVDTTFPAQQYGQIVLVQDINAWSVCEHHLLPFSIDASVAYIANGRLLGLSKFVRIVEKTARALQVQERITEQVAGRVARATASPDVAVLVRGRHLCIEARGVRSCATTTSVKFLGRFESDPAIRGDFIALTQRSDNAGSGDPCNEGTTGRAHQSWIR